MGGLLLIYSNLMFWVWFLWLISYFDDCRVFRTSEAYHLQNALVVVFRMCDATVVFLTYNNFWHLANVIETKTRQDKDQETKVSLFFM